MKIVFLGAPGAGKGSYAKRLKGKYNAEHISTGDLLRKAVTNETELGIQAREFMNQGQLIPNEIIINLLKEKLQQNNWIFLDGFPRTIEQAKALSEISKIDLVLNFDVADETILRRLGGRIICKNCGEIFNKKTIIPKQEGICDKCGKKLYQREDDKDEVIKERLKTYKEKTKPIEDFYKELGILKTIDGNKDIRDPTCRIIQNSEKFLDELKEKHL